MNLVSSSFWAALVASASLAIAACSGASNGIGNGNGNQTCTTTPCGTSGNSIQTCTSQPSGGCSNVTYTVGSQSFSCSSCQGCTAAAQQAAQACLSEPVDGGGSDGGNGTCSAAVPCGADGRTYQECTILGADGTCASLDYKTSDGHNFSCPGCMNCASVAENLQSYCATAPTDGGGGNTSCSTAVSCGNTGTTYQECTTTSAGACTGIAYKISNGVSYSCASCGNCTAALEDLDAYCAGTGATTACTAWEACGDSATLQYEQCTTSLDGTCETIYYQSSDSQMFTCNSCGDCSAALTSLESYCNSTVTPVTNCAAPAACGSGSVTYELCTTTTGSTCTSEYYSTSDGNTFTCSGCDCTTAGSQLSTYCASLNTSNCNPACTTGNICCLCNSGTTYECLSSSGGTLTCASYTCQ
jgi:hypothetical protein